MKRRRFLAAGLGATLAIGAHSAGAQARYAMRRVTWIGPAGFEDRAEVIRRALGERGFVEGRTLEMRLRSIEPQESNIQAVVDATIAGGAELIIAQGRLTGPVQKAIAQRVPLVMSSSGDVVAGGLVDSWRRPGRRTTGVSLLVLELAGKRLQILNEIAPEARRVAILLNSRHHGYEAEREATRRAAAALSLETDVFDARAPDEFPPAFDAIARRRMTGLVFFPDATMTRMASTIAGFAIRERIPCVAGWPEFVQRGALASYGVDLTEAYRRMGDLAARVLQGADASEIAVEQPTRIHLAVNLGTAKAIGVDLPQALIARADEVIR